MSKCPGHTREQIRNRMHSLAAMGMDEAGYTDQEMDEVIQRAIDGGGLTECGTHPGHYLSQDYWRWRLGKKAQEQPS